MRCLIACLRKALVRRFPCTRDRFRVPESWVVLDEESWGWRRSRAERVRLGPENHGRPCLELLPSFSLFSHHTTHLINAARPSFGYALAEGVLVPPLPQQISLMDEHQPRPVAIYSPREEAANPSALPYLPHPAKRTAPVHVRVS